MCDKESKRKCFKCGKSPASDNVKLFRFPKPAVRNLVRCTLWAKYLFAAEEQHASIAFQHKLFSEHRMLCENHFSLEDFTDSSMKRLVMTAVPHDNEQVHMILPAYSSQPGPSRIATEKYGAATSSTSTQSGSSLIIPEMEQCSRIPLRDITNINCVNEKHPMQSEKEKLLYKKCSKYMRKICQMRRSIKNLKNKVLLNKLTDSNSVRHLSKKITPTFARLLQSQIKNSNRKSTGRRWTKKDKILALRLFKRSPTCYRLLRRLFTLPSPSTLKALLNNVPFKVGLTEGVLGVLKQFVKKIKPYNNQFILMFDEMAIRKNLQYNNKMDHIEGYQDHGGQGRSPIVASYALVFMIAGIRKRVKQPIAHFFSSGFSTADRLAVLLKEILHKCFEANIKILATVCDMDGDNRRALSILGATKEEPYITINNERIIALFDTPHLLKCFRNLFMKYDIECAIDISSEGQTGKGVAKWAHIKKFHELDNSNKNFVFAPAITKDHLDPNNKQKMRVKLAAQVLSHCVATGLYAKISDGVLPAEAVVTANVVSNLDKLFDCLNSDNVDLRRGKRHSTNMTTKGPHLEHLLKMKLFFKNMRFVGSSRTPPSQEGWIWTINGVVCLFQHLSKIDQFKSLATRRLQQDPIENLFGCIRGNCGSNTNPTAGQFVAGLKTTILSSMAHIGQTGNNCEDDDNTTMHNFNTLLSVTEEPTTEVIEEQQPDDEIDFDCDVRWNDDTQSEMEACAYVCGFLIKKIPTKNCNVCMELLKASHIQDFHILNQCREYENEKNSLNYASKTFVSCVETCANIINDYLNKKGHEENLKKNIIELINKINFNFLDKCSEHKNMNINFITKSVFFICIRRFCTKKNRLLADEASASALKRKMNIILHK